MSAFVKTILMFPNIIRDITEARPSDIVATVFVFFILLGLSAEVLKYSYIKPGDTRKNDDKINK